MSDEFPPDPEIETAAPELPARLASPHERAGDGLQRFKVWLVAAGQTLRDHPIVYILAASRRAAEDFYTRHAGLDAPAKAAAVEDEHARLHVTELPD